MPEREEEAFEHARKSVVPRQDGRGRECGWECMCLWRETETLLSNVDSTFPEAQGKAAWQCLEGRGTKRSRGEVNLQGHYSREWEKQDTDNRLFRSAKLRHAAQMQKTKSNS